MVQVLGEFLFVSGGVLTVLFLIVSLICVLIEDMEVLVYLSNLVCFWQEEDESGLSNLLNIYLAAAGCILVGFFLMEFPSLFLTLISVSACVFGVIYARNTVDNQKRQIEQLTAKLKTLRKGE